MLRRIVTTVVVLVLALAPTAHATFPGENGKIALFNSTINPDGTGEDGAAPRPRRLSPAMVARRLEDPLRRGPQLQPQLRLPHRRRELGRDRRHPAHLLRQPGAHVVADGSKIAFIGRSCSTCPYQVYVMDADGSGVTPITSGTATAFGPR